MDQWLCLNHGSRGARAALVIAAPSAFDAREIARLRFDGSEAHVSKCSPDHRADLEIRFVGDDFNHGGSADGKKRQIRERTGDAWGDWTNG